MDLSVKGKIGLAGQASASWGN